MTASSIYFQSLPYGLDPATQLIDYEGVARLAKIYKPRLLICGASAYPRDWDYKALRAIADEHGAYLMADIAHTSGLVAAGELADPFQYCDVVTTTTHKTLRGPRAGLIFFKRDADKAKDLEKRINDAVFPACQGGPHNNVCFGNKLCVFSSLTRSLADHCRYRHRPPPGVPAHLEGVRQAGHRERDHPRQGARRARLQAPDVGHRQPPRSLGPSTLR